VKKIIRSVLSFLSIGIMLSTVAACGSSVIAQGPVINLKAGEVVTFSENEAGGLENGWWDAESAGNWSQSDRPILNLKYDDAFENGMNLNIAMSAFVVEKNPEISVSIKANGEFVKETSFNVRKPFEDVALNISKELLSKNKGLVTLTFEIKNAAVPNEVGYNTDVRRLGIFLGQMIATPIA
jgi:hypothetical protein